MVNWFVRKSEDEGLSIGEVRDSFILWKDRFLNLALYQCDCMFQVLFLLSV